MFLAADGILIKSTMGGFVILGSKLACKFTIMFLNFLSANETALKLMTSDLTHLGFKRARALR